MPKERITAITKARRYRKKQSNERGTDKTNDCPRLRFTLTSRDGTPSQMSPKFLFDYDGDELPRLLNIRDGSDTGYHEFHYEGLYVE